MQKKKPVKREKKLYGTYISLTEEQKEFLKKKKRRSKLNKSVVIREALDQYIYNDVMKERVKNDAALIS